MVVLIHFKHQAFEIDMIFPTGGHTKICPYRSIMENVSVLGLDEALKIARLEYRNFRQVHAFAREHGILCESQELDTVDVIYDQKTWDDGVTAIDFMRRVFDKDELVTQYKVWNSREAEERFLCKGAIGAITYVAGSVSAYKFVIGILKIALCQGLNLQTNTPATLLSKEKEGWSVETPRGNIRATKLVLATNGYTAYMYPKLQGVIVCKMSLQFQMD